MMTASRKSERGFPQCRRLPASSNFLTLLVILLDSIGHRNDDPEKSVSNR
jgi:hypothetical protein